MNSHGILLLHIKCHQGKVLGRKNHIFPNLAGGVVSVGHFDNHTCWLVRKKYEYMKNLVL